MVRSEPDDDINYTVLALMLLEEHGLELETEHVARAWLRYLPAGAVFTAERAAYQTLLNRAHEYFAIGAPAGFDVSECADNPYSEWIGAQIRADLYGWVCPGRPALAADLARRDASLSHRGDGIHGAVFVAAFGAAIPESPTLEAALEVALREIPADSGVAAAVSLGRAQAGSPEGDAVIRAHYQGLSPVHTLNNLSLVVWALLGNEDFAAVVGNVVAAGLDTDCNGATAGGLWGLGDRSVPEAWTRPWQGRVAVSLAGHSEFLLDSLVDRTVGVAERLAREG
jgi:ADP-ribosylglycohydrolase